MCFLVAEQLYIWYCLSVCLYVCISVCLSQIFGFDLGSSLERWEVLNPLLYLKYWNPSVYTLFFFFSVIVAVKFELMQALNQQFDDFFSHQDMAWVDSSRLSITRSYGP